MALFWSKKSKSEKPRERVEETSAKTAKVVKAKAVKAVKAVKKQAIVPAGITTGNVGSSADAVLRPHVTEKSGIMAQNNVYTFQVVKGATKPSIAKAVLSLYKVRPIKINVINLPAKNVFIKGRWGTVSGMRKAVVTLKKGDKIEFV
jgi:large subunit ribosomal protein L23